MTDEELDASIRALPEAPLPAALAAHVHSQAGAVFAGEARVRRVAGIVTATAAVSAVALYLTWAVQFLNALAGG
jgi:hypothetical protein